jgi:hypothetical protein
MAGARALLGRLAVFTVRSMILVLVALAVVLHLLVPIALAGWLRSGRATSRFDWLVVLLALVAYCAILVPAGAGWIMLGLDTRYALLLVVVALVATSGRQLRALPSFRRPRLRQLALYTFSALLLACTVPGLPLVQERHHYEGSPVTLSFPLHDGRYAIANGGGNELVNAHAVVPGQRYALDISKVDALGMRAHALAPSDVTRYAIYGERVHAPCSGSVLFRADDQPDLVPPAMDPAHPAGNHVVIRCEGSDDVSILLAHLQPGSVPVSTGDHVQVGDAVGRAGNSGNTSEPQSPSLLSASQPEDGALTSRPSAARRPASTAS